MRNKKVILDTNLWISFLITKNHTEIDDLIIKGKIKLIFSTELVEEFLTVTSHPKFKKYFNKQDIEELLEIFDTFAELINVKLEISECRDPKNNFLLSLAAESKADYLVTGDFDLLTLKKIRKTKILTWKDFINELK
ncbi:MAG: putative toxin-antitoxin system toxin component, PIN family [Bacteroidales bacterium]|nr:putative toxin-antitoxin system toxin component, PIN family [Bacteroidales bacterium]